MTDTWFVEFRLAWIKESVEIFGCINREHIERKFRISTPQASNDIALVLRRWPDLMTYNKSAKRYELTRAALSRALEVGLARVLTQRESVLAAWRMHEDVDAVFQALHRAVPKSSIRTYLGNAERAGELDGSWRKRRRRAALSRAPGAGEG